MPFLGHLPELLIVLVLALLVFGPKRMIEMGSSLGKSLGELRRSLKDVPGLENFANFGGLLKDDENQEPRQTPFSVASQFAQNLSIESKDEPPAALAPASPTVVDAAPPHSPPTEAPHAAPPPLDVAPPDLRHAAPLPDYEPADMPHAAPLRAEPKAE